MYRKALSFTNVKRYRLGERKSKVGINMQGVPFQKGTTFAGFYDSLPGVLAASGLKSAVEAIVEARKKDRPVILAMGAHPVKTGLSRIIIDLMEKGMVTAFAANGASIIHDFELALAGYTSEDVAEQLCTGAFGMAEETGTLLNEAIIEGVRDGFGIGYAVGRYVSTREHLFPHRCLSIFARAFELSLPVTVHVAIGTDIIHMHPEADGAAIGQGSLRDFKLLASVITGLSGGVFINLGSAVIIPEVFLKALNLARNTGHSVEDFTTINMDFIKHYRAEVNVLKRPTMHSGKAIHLTGHHEIMFPLLAAAVQEKTE